MKCLLSLGALARSQRPPGFTLLELLVVLFITGILATIMAATWHQFAARWQLDRDLEVLASAMRTAREQARYQKVDLVVGIREHNGRAEWAIYPDTSSPESAHWQPLSARVQIDASETSLVHLKSGIYKVEFSHKGALNGQLGRVTLKLKGDTSPKGPKRCVIASTFLGKLSYGENRSKKYGKYYCY